jgi:hypothetical protein
MMKWLAVGFVCVAVAGCAAPQGPHPGDLVTPLTKLTPAVEAQFRYHPNGPVPDDRLVAEAMKNKPELQKAFDDLPIKVWHDDRYVVLLVCSPDGKYCWLEDASWTPNVVDRKCYECKPLPPAEFTLKPPQRTK